MWEAPRNRFLLLWKNVSLKLSLKSIYHLGTHLGSLSITITITWEPLITTEKWTIEIGRISCLL